MMSTGIEISITSANCALKGVVDTESGAQGLGNALASVLPRANSTALSFRSIGTRRSNSTHGEWREVRPGARAHTHTIPYHKDGLVRRGLENGSEAAEQRDAMHKPEGGRHQRRTLARPAHTGIGTEIRYLTRTLFLQRETTRLLSVISCSYFMR